MGIRPRILVGLLVAALGAVVAWQLLRPSEPIYNGKPVSYWISRSGSYFTRQPFPLLSADSNAIPYLIKALNTQESVLARPYARLWFSLPFWINKYMPQPLNAAQMRSSAAMSLGALGGVAKPAIPALLRAMKEDKSQEVRGWSAYSLGRLGNQQEWSSGQLGNQEEIVIAALTQALNDSAASVRIRAAQALELFGHAASNAVPTLKKCVDDENPEVSAAAASALFTVKRHVPKSDNNRFD